MTGNTYDVIVLGGGAGGVPAAVRAAQLGGRVAVVENNLFGGLCMNRGCVPFGHMMVASNILGSLSLGRDMGLDFSGVSSDYTALLKRQDELIAFMRQGVESTLKKNKVDIIKGKGRLSGKGKLEVNGKTISCKKIILATGARWIEPDFPGADLKEVINSDELLETDKLPKRALLFGSTPWLIEIAQFLHRFGSRVTLATAEKALLANENKPIRSRLQKALKEQGIRILSTAKISAIKKKKDGLHCVLKAKKKDETIVVDRVICLRRKASLAGLGLDTVGLDDKSDFKVDWFVMIPVRNGRNGHRN